MNKTISLSDEYSIKLDEVYNAFFKEDYTKGQFLTTLVEDGLDEIIDHALYSEAFRIISENPKYSPRDYFYLVSYCGMIGHLYENGTLVQVGEEDKILDNHLPDLDVILTELLGNNITEEE